MFRKFFGGAVTTLLVVAALALGCWFAFSAFSGANIVVFRTDSMSPTMPQGALAITVPVRAPEVRVGDVITLQRSGESLPVTHRVIQVDEVVPRSANDADIRAASPGSGAPDLRSPDARQLVMQGDANLSSDPQPYAITEARKTIFSIPHLGAAVMLMQSPIGMGTLILVVGALVTWAFWPRAHADPPQGESAPATHPLPRHAREEAQ